MFHRTGQPRTTRIALQLLYNAAWASSLGGLALLAEERRRRVAFAQKIIENGKRLQAHKSYATAAAVAVFDLGEEWSTNLPNLAHDQGLPKPSLDQALTNNEWRSRRRLHRPMPTAGPVLCPLEQSCSGRDSYTDMPELAFPPPSRLIRGMLHPFQLESIQSSQAEILAVQVGEPATTASEVDTTIKSTRVKNTKRYRRYAGYLQGLVAARITECFSSEDPTLRAAGFRELSFFFERSRKLLRPSMQEAVSLAWKAPISELQKNLSPQVQSRIQESLKSTQIAQPAPESTPLEVLFPNPSRVPVEVDEEQLVSRLYQFVKEGQLDGAFFEFLTLCETATEPISRTTRKAIRELTDVYKALGVFSIVSEIHQRSLHLLKEWRLIYADLLWVMDRGDPEKNVEFCWAIIQAFVSLGEVKKQSLIDICVRCVQWFVRNNRSEHGIYLFSKIFQQGQIDCTDQNVIELAEDLYHEAIIAECFGQARNILSWLVDRGITFSRDPTWVTNALSYLIRHGRVEDCAELYLATLRCFQSPSELQACVQSRRTSDRVFEQTVYKRCDELIRTFHDRQAYGRIVELGALFDDHSKLSTKTRLYFYHAYANAGSLTDAKRTVENLATSTLPLGKNIIRNSHSILLSRCWTLTKNFDMTQDLYFSIRALEAPETLSVRTLNAMILACVEAGRPDLVEKYFKEMVDGVQIEPNLTTWSHLMLGRALAKDWNGVGELLQSVRRSGLLPSSGSHDGRFFDKIFIEFCRQHNADQILDFAVLATNENSMSITKVVADNVVNAIIRAESVELLSIWAEHLHRHGFDPTVSHESISLLLHRVLQAGSLKFNPHLSSALHLQAAAVAEGPDQLLDLMNAINTKQGSDNSPVCGMPQIGAVTVKTSVAKHRREIERKMLNALSRKEPLEAVRLYKESLVHGIPRQQVDLDLAVHGMLTADPSSLIAARKLVDDAQEAGLNVDRVETAFLIHRLRQQALTEEQAYQIVFGFYRQVNKPGIRLHHHVTLAVVRNLLTRKNPRAALRIIEAVHHSEWGQRKPFDLVAMTTTLRLFITLEHLEGVDWVVEVVLERRMRLDQTFIRALQLGRQTSWRRHDRSWGQASMDQHGSNWIASLNRHIHLCQIRRKEQRAATLRFAKKAVEVLASAKEKQADEVLTSVKANQPVELLMPASAQSESAANKEEQ